MNAWFCVEAETRADGAVLCPWDAGAAADEAVCGLDCGACAIRRMPFDAEAAAEVVVWFKKEGGLKEEEAGLLGPRGICVDRYSLCNRSALCLPDHHGGT